MYCICGCMPIRIGRRARSVPISLLRLDHRARLVSSTLSGERALRDHRSPTTAPPLARNHPSARLPSPPRYKLPLAARAAPELRIAVGEAVRRGERKRDRRLLDAAAGSIHQSRPTRPRAVSLSPLSTPFVGRQPTLESRLVLPVSSNVLRDSVGVQVVGAAELDPREE